MDVFAKAYCDLDLHNLIRSSVGAHVYSAEIWENGGNIIVIVTIQYYTGLPPRTFAALYLLSYSVFDFDFFHYFSFLGHALD